MLSADAESAECIEMIRPGQTISGKRQTTEQQMNRRFGFEQKTEKKKIKKKSLMSFHLCKYL